MNNYDTVIECTYNPYNPIYVYIYTKHCCELRNRESQWATIMNNKWQENEDGSAKTLKKL